MLCFGLACATGYHPVLSAEPNPFRGIQSFAVQPLEYIDLVVDEVSEEEFLARKKEEAEKWTTIKANIKSDYEEAFRNGLEQAGLLGGPRRGVCTSGVHLQDRHGLLPDPSVECSEPRQHPFSSDTRRW